MLNGKIVTQKDHAIYTAFLLCKIDAFKSTLISTIARNLPRDKVIDIIGEMPVDYDRMCILGDTLKLVKSPIYSPNKTFNQTISEVEEYLFH